MKRILRIHLDFLLNTFFVFVMGTIGLSYLFTLYIRELGDAIQGRTNHVTPTDKPNLKIVKGEK